MPIQKRLFALLIAAWMFCFMYATVFAHEVPDLSEKGSIRITMSDGGEAVPGGTLTLYRVGSVKEHDGDYNFELTGDFAESKVSLKNIASARTAKELAAYAEKKNLAGTTKEISREGTLAFSDLKVGLYLLVQKEPAGGYYKADPFVVSVPMLEDGVYLYDVDASPKAELEETPGKPHKPGRPPAPSGPPAPSAPPDLTLPQTGQMNWPVPVLVSAGLCLFAAGWYLRFGKRSESYEK